jgi:Dolichyl-phosphate-mannose-protein mannosyltransferase
MDIISYKGWYSNNHLLNTLFMKYSEKIFGSSEIALRLPNLLLLIVYMVYSYLLFRKTNHLLSLALFVLLCTNVLLIDLFGLARGYGLSCGFMLMSLYHFIQSFHERKTKNLIFFHTGALLAILSNFTLLTFFAALMLVYNLMVLIDHKFISKDKYNFFNLNKVHLVPLLLEAVILYEPIRRVLKFNSLDFGGKNDFYSDTVKNLIYNSLYNIHLSQFAMVGLQIIFTAIVMVSFIIIIKKILNHDETFFKKFTCLIISNFLVIFISLSIILLHIILGIDYPVSRFSIFLYPVFIVHFGFLLYYFISTGYKKFTLIIAFGLSLVFAASFVLKADLHTSAEWEYDSETKNMIRKLEAYHSMNGSGQRKIKLGIDWLFEPTINFYRQTQGIDWLMPADRNGIKEDDDYYYIFKTDLNILNSADYTVIFKFKRTNTCLLKNNKSR